ncbi:MULTISPECIES: lipoprotein insertase outer membrane protein LolB [unclassified Vibrio]|uniref:Outer-membrane lipoprotein LolB n=1 Tax=Vibrio sp. HB236076 TaxID=3232307 RepID=A0AB39HCX9_9VIBR|nr:lipoprotein insertase outer membrane protein LolB [Vibrio sp. HB161653]MDP5254227.1 lipoprotein insertase outer membrane protein LolB [Vibrio sp. HB161653]
MTKPISLWLCTALIVLIAGCSTLPSTHTSVEWQQHQQRLNTIKHFKVAGKLGYISPEERQNLNFFWQHQPQQSQLRLTTFLGQTVMKLTITPEQATLIDYDGNQHRAKDVDQLMWQMTGLNIPVSSLPHWLLGLPQGDESFTLNSQNTLATLATQSTSQPWQAKYQLYTDVNGPEFTLPLPSRLTILQGEIKINLQVNQWTLLP